MDKESLIEYMERQEYHTASRLIVTPLLVIAGVKLPIYMSRQLCPHDAEKPKPPEHDHCISAGDIAMIGIVAGLVFHKKVGAGYNYLVDLSTEGLYRLFNRNKILATPKDPGLKVDKDGCSPYEIVESKLSSPKP